MAQSCKLRKKLEDDWPESIFPQALFQPRRHLFTSMRRARGDAQCVWSHESSISSSYERQHGSVCASCIVPGCCAQVALCKLLHASGSTSVFKLFCARCSVQVAQDARRLYLRARCSAGAELWRCSAHYTSALQGCDFPVGAARSTLRILRLLCLSRSCDRAIAKAGARTTRQLPKAISRVIKPHGATARALPSTTPTPAEGRAGTEESQKTSSFCTLTTPIPAESQTTLCR